MARAETVTGNGNDITAQEYARWMTPTQALDLLPSHWPFPTKAKAIALSLRDGLIRAVADVLAMEDREPVPLLDLPKEVWRHWGFGVDGDFWNAGLHEVFADTEGYNGPGFRAHRVRLDPEGVKALIPPGTVDPARREDGQVPATAIPVAGAPGAPSPRAGLYIDPVLDPSSHGVTEGDMVRYHLNAGKPAQRHGGGRPPKAWWDDLWVEMFRQIWESELKPQSMTDIANAMLQWASDNGHELSDSSAKRAARKLWAVAKPEGS